MSVPYIHWISQMLGLVMRVRLLNNLPPIHASYPDPALQTWQIHANSSIISDELNVKGRHADLDDFVASLNVFAFSPRLVRTHVSQCKYLYIVPTKIYKNWEYLFFNWIKVNFWWLFNIGTSWLLVPCTAIQVETWPAATPTFTLLYLDRERTEVFEFYKKYVICLFLPRLFFALNCCLHWRPQPAREVKHCNTTCNISRIDQDACCSVKSRLGLYVEGPNNLTRWGPNNRTPASSRALWSVFIWRDSSCV